MLINKDTKFDFPFTGGRKQSADWLCIAGSRLYGLHNEDSDYDYRGIVVNHNSRYVFGIDKFEHLSLNKPEEKLDISIYDLKHFLKLCLNGSPNIVELLYVPDKSTHLIASDPLIENFMALVKKQVSKTWINNMLCFSKSEFKASGVDSHTFDSQSVRRKRLMHAYRLAFQVEQLLSDGRIVYPFDDEDIEFLRHIKSGNIDKEHTAISYKILIQRLEKALEDSLLPKHSNPDEVWDLYIEYYKGVFR